MNFPIDLSFKILALASQIYIRDANGHLLGYVKQKLLKLKEDINVFADENQTQILFNIKADRIIDFSARYNFTTADGRFIGSIKRQGRRSIWKAHYEISDNNNQQILQIREENAWIKFGNALVGELPLIGMFTGYFLNPSYIASTPDNQNILQIQKQPAFMESKFTLNPKTEIPADKETLLLLSCLTMVLLERGRG